MSDSSIALKPVIDEPSKPMPSSSAPSSSLERDREALQVPLDVGEPEKDVLDPLLLTRASTSRRASGSDVARALLSIMPMARLPLARRSTLTRRAADCYACYPLRTRGRRATAAEATRPRDSGRRAAWGLFAAVRGRSTSTAGGGICPKRSTTWSNGAETAPAPAEALEWSAQDAGEDGRPQVHRPARVLAAHDAADVGVRRELVRGRPRLRRLLDPGLAGDLRERHAAHAAGRHGDPRPVHRGADDLDPLRDPRPDHARAVHEGPAPARPTRRGVPALDRHRRHVATSGPRASSSSSTRSPTT